MVYVWVLGLTADLHVATLLMAARMAIVEADEAGRGSSFFENIVTLSIIVALLAFLEREKGPKRSTFAIVIAFILNTLTGAKNGVIIMALALICIDGLKHDGIRWKRTSVGLLIILVFFCTMAILLQHGEARAGASLLENVGPVTEDLLSYTAGGIVAYDRIVRNPSIIVHSWQVNRFFLDTLNKLGWHFDLRSDHADFVNIGPNLTQNVYTMYFAYLDQGYMRTAIIMVGLGLITTLFYLRAIAGNRLYIVAYSCLFVGLLLSPFAEELILNLNFLVKMFALTWLMYAWSKRCQTAPATA